MAGEPPLLVVDHVTKRFSGTLALNRVNLSLKAGEVHALLGENGAGKSTLIKVLAGVYQPDDGMVRWRGEASDPVTRPLPISFIHQDLGLVDQMTVAENIALVAGYPQSRRMINWRLTRARAVYALDAIGSHIDPERKVAELSAAEKAIVAIARALACDSDLLVLDEPTAALPEDDVVRLLAILDRLRARGKAILYVTHRLDEVFRIADTVTILRDGSGILTTSVRDVTPDALVANIVGRPLESVFIRHTPRGGPAVVSVRGLHAADAGPVDFDIAPGEVVAMVGLRGSGHDAVGRAIYGDTAVRAGEISLAGVPYRSPSPANATRRGIGMVASKRHEESLAPRLSVRENLFFHPASVKAHFGGFIPPRAERSASIAILDRYSVRPRDTERAIATLSGGNQQKVVVARWLESDIRLLVLEEPTIGVDVGAKSEIYALLQRSLDRGLGVLLVSSDFEEVVGIANRALVFDRGRVSAHLGQGELSAAALTGLAGGRGRLAEKAEADAEPRLDSVRRTVSLAQSSSASSARPE